MDLKIAKKNLSIKSYYVTAFLSQSIISKICWSKFKIYFHEQFLKLFNYPLKNLKAKYHFVIIMQEVWFNQVIKLVETLIKLMLKRFQAVINAVE